MIKNFIKNYINKKLYRRKALRYVNVAHSYLKTKDLKNYDLEKEDCNLIDKMWSDLRCDLGRKTYDWHKFYKGFVGHFDVRYIPSDIYNPLCEYTFNERRYSLFLQHKSMLRTFINKGNRIKSIVDLIDGVFYDDEFNIISTEEVKQRLKKVTVPIIVKPSIGSGGGRRVEYLKDGLEVDLNRYIKAGDFSFQYFFDEGYDLKRFNEDTVNTIRMITLNLNGKVSVLSSFLRMGKSGMRIDNLSSGGMLIGINQNGYLADFALDKNLDKIEKSPSGIVFKGEHLSSYQKIVDFALANHSHIPLAKLIAWDFAVNKNNDPIVIEINLDSGEIQFHQIYNGPLFGDRTDEVIEYVKSHPIKRIMFY